MSESSLLRIVVIAGAVVGAHLVAIGIRAASRRVLRSRMSSQAKVLTVTGFTTSVFLFGIYFAAVGFVLTELGVSLTTYLASASVIGLAVSFGSQGVVQDVITGLTVVLSDLLDVGDMVEIGGQIGIVESVGMRFTVLVNFSGAHVFVPNRSIMNVSNYPKGYIRAYLDARLPSDPSLASEVETHLEALGTAAYHQFPGILLLPPTYEGRFEAEGSHRYARTKFRIWPGQGALLESAIKQAACAALKKLDPEYADWMVTVHYRAEPPSVGKKKPGLPRPHALLARARELEASRLPGSVSD